MNLVTVYKHSNNIETIHREELRGLDEWTESPPVSNDGDWRSDLYHFAILRWNRNYIDKSWGLDLLLSNLWGICLVLPLEEMPIIYENKAIRIKVNYSTVYKKLFN